MSYSSPFIQETLAAIQPVPQAGMCRAQVLWDRLTKPQGSLGRLESLGTQYVAITQSLPVKNPDAMMFVLAADHGVAGEESPPFSPS